MTVLDTYGQRSKTARSGAFGRGLAAIPWWRWPSALSLDAPLVAVVWQVLLVRIVGASFSPALSFLLFAPVWLVYVADRMIDSRRVPSLPHSTERHGLHAHAFGWLAALWLATLLSGLTVAFVVLEPRQWLAALGLLSTTLLYFVLVHSDLVQRISSRGRPFEHRFAVKELSVGVLFALGVCMFPLLAVPLEPWHGWLALTLAGLCSLNCLFISLWEAELERPTTDSTRSRSRSFGQDSKEARRRIKQALGVQLLLALVPFASLFSSGVLLPYLPSETAVWFLCVLASTTLLCLLDVLHLSAQRSRLPAFLSPSLETSRILADVVLLTPLVIVLVP